MALNSEVILRVRDALDELTEAQWTDVQLRRWINDGMADLARTTRFYEQTADVSVIAGAATVALPASVLEIQQAYWIPTSSPTRIAPLSPRHFEGMDQIWGDWSSTTGDPTTFAPRGISPNLVAYLYPVPSEAGTLRVFYAGLPTAIDIEGGDDASTCPVPDGWVDVLVHYVEYRALRKDRDPRWQEARQLFETDRTELAMHENVAVAREVVFDPVVGGMSRWLVDPDYV